MTIAAAVTLGSVIRIAGKGAAGWILQANTGQTIHFGDVDTTTGTGGSVSSQNRYDGIELICVVANTDFVVVAAQGNMVVI